MMFDQTFTKALGLELLHLGDHHYSGRYCQLERKGNELQITGKKIVEGSLVNVLAALPKKLPLALVLSGKGIIHKSLSITEEETKVADAFKAAFPSIQAEQFFIQQYNDGPNYSVSIARKDWILDLLEKLKQSGHEVYRLSFGGVVGLQVLPQLNVYGDEANFDGHQFLLEAKQFQSYSYQSELKSAFPMKIGEEPIAEELLVSYAAAFQLLLQDKLNPIVADVLEVNERFERKLQSAVWQKRGLLFLTGVFMLLLISFAIFSHYNAENEKLLKQVGAQLSNTEHMELLQQNIIKQEQLLKQLNWNGGYNYGFLLNEIGSSMPRPLTMLGLTMNDFKTEQEKSERLPNIKIKGLTANLTAVNNWIFVLREKKWVKGAKLLKFQEEEGELYGFDILITY